MKFHLIQAILISQIVFFTEGHSDVTTWKNTVTVEKFSDLVNQPYVAVYFAAGQGRPKDAFTQRFNNHFADAKNYLSDFGVEVGVVDCFTSSEHQVCNKEGIEDHVFFYRKGRLLTDLPLDTMFNLDAIVANILHLVLLQEVPLLQNRAELDKFMAGAAGKRDIMLARMKAVGIPEDRAFIETAFAFNGKYQFIMTTVNDDFGIDSGWESGSNSVWLLQCTKVEPGQQCPVVPFTNVITLEKLVIFMKGLQVSNAVELTEDSAIEFLQLDIPVLYLSGSSDQIPQLRTLMNTLAGEFVGSVGFILINRDTVTDNIKQKWDVSRFLDCVNICVFLESQDRVDAIEGTVTIDTVREALVKILVERNESDMQEDEDDEEADDEIYTTSQETQDDPLEVALFRLQAERQLNISHTQLLTDKTFPEFIGNNMVSMVLFTVKWNPICMTFVEDYQEAGLVASDWTKNGSNPLARVECSDWPDVCELNNVTNYPVLKLYKTSNLIEDYHGGFEIRNVLKAFFLHNTKQPIYLSSKLQFWSFIEGSNPKFAKEYLESVVIGIFPENSIEERKIFGEIAEELRGSFLLAECSQDCAVEGSNKFNTDGPSVVVIKWRDSHQPYVVFHGAFSELSNFISASSKHVLPELSPATLPSLLQHQHQSIVMLFHQRDASSLLAENELAKVAIRKQFDPIPMAWIDTSSEGNLGRRIFQSYSLPIQPDFPQLVYLNRKINSVCLYPHSPQYSESLLTEWLENTLNEGQTCSAALKHREWKEMVKAYDFLAYIREDEAKLEKEKVDHKPSGRIRQTKHVKQDKELVEEPLENEHVESKEKVATVGHAHTEL